MPFRTEPFTSWPTFSTLSWAKSDNHSNLFASIRYFEKGVLFVVGFLSKQAKFFTYVVLSVPLFLLFSFFHSASFSVLLSPSDLWWRSGVDSCLHSAAAQWAFFPTNRGPRSWVRHHCVLGWVRMCVCVFVCAQSGSVRETFTVGERDIRWERTPPPTLILLLTLLERWRSYATPPTEDPSEPPTHAHTYKHTRIHSRPTHKGEALSICGLCGRGVTSLSPPVLRVQNKH